MNRLDELQLAADQFNNLAPIGTKLRVCKGAVHHADAKWVDSVVIAPGAFVLGGHSVVVKIPGDSVRVTHVEIVK